MSKLRLASRSRAGPGLSEKEQIDLAIRLSLQQEQAQLAQQVAQNDLQAKFEDAALAQPQLPGGAQPQILAPVKSQPREELPNPSDSVDQGAEHGDVALRPRPIAAAQPTEPTGQAPETLSKRKAARRRTYRDVSDSEDEGGHDRDADDYAPAPESSEEEGSDSDFEADESEDERPKKKARKPQAAAKKAPAAKKAAAGGRGKATGAPAPKPAAAAKQPKPAAAKATAKAAAATSGKGKASGALAAAAKAAPPAPEPPRQDAAMEEEEDGKAQGLAHNGADPDAGGTAEAGGVAPISEGQQAAPKGAMGAKPAGPPKAKPVKAPKAVPAGLPKPKPAAPAKAVPAAAPQPSGALASAASKTFSLPKPSVGAGGAGGKVAPQAAKPLGLSNRTPSAGAPSSSAPFKPPVLPGAAGASSVGKSTPAAAAGGGPSVKPPGSSGGGIKFPPGSGACMVSGLRRPAKKPAT